MSPWVPIHLMLHPCAPMRPMHPMRRRVETAARMAQVRASDSLLRELQVRMRPLHVVRHPKMVQMAHILDMNLTTEISFVNQA